MCQSVPSVLSVPKCANVSQSVPKCAKCANGTNGTQCRTYRHTLPGTSVSIVECITQEGGTLVPLVPMVTLVNMNEIYVNMVQVVPRVPLVLIGTIIPGVPSM